MALEQIAADIEKLDYIQQPVIERAVSSEYNLKIQEIDDILTNGLAAVKPQNTVQLNAQKLDSPLYDGDSVEAKIKNQIGKNIIKEKTLEHSLNYLTDQDLKSFTEDSVVRQKVEDLINKYGLDSALLKSQTKVDTLETEIDAHYDQRSAITLGETISPEEQLINKVIETHKTLGYFDFSDDKSAEMSVEEAREYIEKVKSIYGSDLAESYIDTRHRYSANPDDSYTQIDLIDIKEKMNSHIKASESYTLNEKRTSPTYKI